MHLLTQDDSLIAKLMEKMGLDKNLVINRVEEAIQKTSESTGRSAVCRTGI